MIDDLGPSELPRVSVVFLAHDRRERLLTSLRETIEGGGYPPEHLEVIVVDNASTDGTADAVEQAFPDVTVIRNAGNDGAPGWNRGFAVASGDYVLILDDDAYLRRGGLEQAVVAAQSDGAGLVSFSVVSASDEHHRLNDDWQTGLLSYWGCAALLSGAALRAVGGYDPNIFIWGNEAELTMRLLDRGFRHLYLPEVYAVHMSERIVRFDAHRYRVNARHHGYIAGKLMRAADAVVAVLNIVQRSAIDSVATDRAASVAALEVLAGFTAGLRRRAPVRPAVSSAYRRNFHPFAGPWRFMRSPAERFGSRGDEGRVAELRGRRHAGYYADRAAYYPAGRASLEL